MRNRAIASLPHHGQDFDDFLNSIELGTGG